MFTASDTSAWSRFSQGSAQMESIDAKALQQQLDALVPLIGMDKL